MPTPEELKSLFKQAAEIAEQVPDNLRQVAFQRALDALLGTAPPNQIQPPPRAGEDKKKVEQGAPRRVKVEASGRSGAVTHLLEVMNRSELAELMAGRKVLDRSLLVLKAAQHHGIDALPASDIAQILTQKFREATTPQAVRMALDRSPAYTDRRPSGGTFQYSIMAPGERYLESDSTKPTSADKKTPTKKRTARAAGKAAATTTATTKKTKPGKSERPGPKAILEVLIQEGFFKQTKTIGQILSHLEEKKTHRYSTSDFTATLQRMVRQSKLDRTRNSQGQYEYKAT